MTRTDPVRDEGNEKASLSEHAKEAETGRDQVLRKSLVTEAFLLALRGSTELAEVLSGTACRWSIAAARCSR